MKFTDEELNPPKFRQAVNNMCRECIVDDAIAGNGTWLMQIENCTSYNCSLYCVRPLTSATTKLRAQARRDHTGVHLTSGSFQPGNTVKNTRSS